MSGIDFHFTADQDNQAWQEESWSSHSGTEVPWVMPMQVDTCVWVDNKHVYAGPDCPHYNGLDELGLPVGWTVQNN